MSKEFIKFLRIVTKVSKKEAYFPLDILMSCSRSKNLTDSLQWSWLS